MAEFPALPLWTDAYLADTTDLSAEEHGIYLLLLMAAWRTPTCSLPDDDQRLARMAKVGTKKWRKMRPVMERFFTVSDGQWTQNRLLKERDRVETSRSQKRQAAQAKHAKTHDNGSADAGAESVRKSCNPYPYPYPESNSVSKDTGDQGPPEDDWDSDKQLFERGKAVLGKSAGGQIKRVKDTFGSVYSARQLIETAAGKQSPAEYVEGSIKNERKRQQQRNRPTIGQIAAG